MQQRTLRQSWTKKISKLSAALLLAGIVAGCTEPTVFHRNPVAPLPMGSFQRAWFVDLELTKDPIVKIDVRDKLVYVYTQGKEVIGFDRKSGTQQLLMHVNSPGRELQPLVELKNHLVFPNATSLEVFDLQGNLQKSIPLGIPLRSNVSGENETVYFGSIGANGGLVESYNVAVPYAPQQWEYLTTDGAAVTAGTAVYSGTIFSASEAGEIDAVSVDRAQLWGTPHGAFQTGPVSADLRVDESGLYVASKDYKLSCIDRARGKLKWQYFAGEPLNESPVTTVDSVYIMVPGKGLAAIDKATGPFNRTARWYHPTATQFLAQDERYAYLADPRPSADEKGPQGYAIIAVDKQTMKQAFESDRKDFSVLGTNRKDGTIYAGFPDGKFFAISPVLKGGLIGELVMTRLPADRS